MATSRIFVKGLPPSLTEAEFRKHFSAGNRHVTDVKLMAQRRIGYVGYKSSEEASSAVAYFNKTYIRMSKISVELARPISDSSLRSASGLRDCSDSAAKAPVTCEKNELSKKRKREEPGKADPKLHEFLRVMKPGRSGAIADDTGLYASDEVNMDEVVVSGDDSDDDYHEIPKRPDKLRKVEQPDDNQQAEIQKEVGEVTIREIEAPQADTVVDEDTPQDTEPAVSQAQEARTAATDDDWLRSRTNRLLDLVDADQLTTTIEKSVTNPVIASATQATAVDEEEPHSSCAITTRVADKATDCQEIEGDGAVEAISKTGRLFVRNLPYDATEGDLRETFERYGELQEVHLPANAGGSSKGYALVLFVDASDAVKAFQAMDGMTFQGRILHIIPADRKKQAGLDEIGISKLSLRKQNLIRKRADAATTCFNWNSLWMSQDAVNSSVASRLGVSKSEMLDPTSADAGVKQAIAETSVIQETKAYFAANGVDLEAFKSKKRGDRCILVKNFPYGTSMDELRRMFEEFGAVLKVLMPPSGTIAIVQFAQANHAKAAFGRLAYRRIKDSVLFLEKGPQDLLPQDGLAQGVFNDGLSLQGDGQHRATGVKKLSASELLSGQQQGGANDAESNEATSSLFVRNLNFATTTSKLAEAFGALDGFVSAQVKTKMDAKKPGQRLSMGFGFVEFATKSQSQKAAEAMDGYVLDGHELGVRLSHGGRDAAEQRRQEDRAKKLAARRTKLIIKNLPFQAGKRDVRKLFGTYGQLRCVRVPKKADNSTRGFAFAEFVSAREAENALEALRDTHLLGRRLVVDYAEADAVDAEEEIDKMQRKVGRQTNRVALELLTGGRGRAKVNIGNDEEEPEDSLG